MMSFHLPDLKESITGIIHREIVKQLSLPISGDAKIFAVQLKFYLIL